MYEAVSAHPEGRSTVARFGMTAAEYGYDGVVVRNHGPELAGEDSKRVAERYGLDIVSGVEVRDESPSTAGSTLRRARSEATVLIVNGGSDEINRFAVEQDCVDVLTTPLLEGDAIDHVIAKLAASNEVHLEINLGRVLRAEHGKRHRVIEAVHALWDLIDDAGAPFVISGGPVSHLHLRSPRELMALGETLGLGSSVIEQGLTAWGDLAAVNRDRMGSTSVSPGVTRGQHEEESE